jgi:hypothetical protein
MFFRDFEMFFKTPQFLEKCPNSTVKSKVTATPAAREYHEFSTARCTIPYKPLPEILQGFASIPISLFLKPL